MRVVVSALSLQKAIIPHIGAATVEARVCRHFLKLRSDEATTTLPVYGPDVTTTLPVESLLALLNSLEDQPVTLDLHSWGANRLFAMIRVAGKEGYKHVTYGL